MANSTDDNYQGIPDTDIEEEQGLDLQALIAALLEGKWIILAFALAGLCIAAFYAWIQPSLYTSEALIQIEQKQSSLGAEVLGQGGGALGSTPLQTELQILRSRRVVGNAVDALNYQIHARPRYYPVIGRAYARTAPSGDPIKPPLGLETFAKYAWGNEVIDVARFDVPESHEGKTFILKAGKNDSDGMRFALGLPNQPKPILFGTTGQPATAELDSGRIEIFVRELRARPGTQFLVTRRSQVSAAINLRSHMTTREVGANTGILNLRVTHTDQERVDDMANALAETFQQQNLRRRSAETRQTIEFIKQQVPELEKTLRAAEAKLNKFRLSEGTIDLTRETSLLLNRSTEIDQTIGELQQERERLLQEYLPDHPSVQAIDAELSRLRQERGQLGGEIRQLPEKQQQMLRLQREVTVTNELYAAMQNRIQEFELVKAGLVGSIHIIDEALPARSASSPDRTQLTLIGALLGLALGFGLIFARFMLRTGVDDPNLLESRLGLPSYAVIPFSKAQQQLDQDLKRTQQANVLAVYSPKDVSIEAIRSLRTALQFAQLETDNRTVMITGPMPDIGKSFITVNLGAVLAMSGRKVLIVDADLRKGHLHKQLAMQSGAGVSEYVTGKAGPGDIVQKTQIDGLHLVARGAAPPNPSELLMHENFRALLNVAREKYDHVLVDTPPVLLVTDAAIVGKHCGACLMVVKAGVHPLRTLEEASKRLIQAGTPLKGAIFNQVGRKGSYYGAYGYGSYGANYGYYSYEGKAAKGQNKLGRAFSRLFRRSPA